jgi:hypothetical protein
MTEHAIGRSLAVRVMRGERMLDLSVRPVELAG